MRRPAARDEGTASAFVIGLVVALFVVAGLVVDGGRALNARVAAADVAEQAARAGAMQVDVDELRSNGSLALDPTAARSAAAAYLVSQGYDATTASVAADTTAVHVTVRDEVPTSLLQLIFIPTMAVSGGASARAALGIVDEISLPGGP
ncbi:pilus assembly protein TadG-related protein [Actinotalea sp. M2MS4P-6]|uniref:pilus assembly protein TadG-related protein n=1 Tax=Actinotalea sp. M2MS4P-6 TaxID=2983762 RepID=UPI0021E3C23C|nr:pilus assembly protein TadG-related protein [Actinotalea sp. M2MS4P-6]MCV2394550.1 pilus assembly protein TadG-related protein [Actinotalea sp. M2MS4P-6]